MSDRSDRLSSALGAAYNGSASVSGMIFGNRDFRRFAAMRDGHRAFFDCIDRNAVVLADTAHADQALAAVASKFLYDIFSGTRDRIVFIGPSVQAADHEARRALAVSLSEAQLAYVADNNLVDIESVDDGLDRKIFCGAGIVVCGAERFSRNEMLMIFRALGRGSSMVVCGDGAATARDAGLSGFAHAKIILGSVEGVAHASFGRADLHQPPAAFVPRQA